MEDEAEEEAEVEEEDVGAYNPPPPPFGAHFREEDEAEAETDDSLIHQLPGSKSGFLVLSISCFSHARLSACQTAGSDHPTAPTMSR